MNDIDELFESANSGAVSWYEKCSDEEKAWIAAVAAAAKKKGRSPSPTKTAAAFKERFSTPPPTAATLRKTIRKLAGLDD